MRILMISNFGMGLYKFRKELIQKLINQGNEVYVTLPNDEYVPLLKELGCKYVESKVDRRGTNALTDFKLLVSYIKMIRKIKPEIVLTYTIKPNIYGSIASRITKTPYIPNITGLGTAIENESFIQKITLKLYRISLKRAKFVFFQNESNRQFFYDRSLINSNTKTLPGSGVNLKQYYFETYPEEEKTIKFIYIGRIMKAKGIDELLAAAKKIKETNRDVEFHLIGFCEEDYHQQLKEFNDSEIIHYHGQQGDVQKYIRTSHATVLPSYHEGTSNVLLESASIGRPVLASNVSGCIETFDEGVSGFGFEVQDVDSLVDAIEKFIKLPYDKKKQMGIFGNEKITKEYNRNIVVDSYIEQINN